MSAKSALGSDSGSDSSSSDSDSGDNSSDADSRGAEEKEGEFDDADVQAAVQASLRGDALELGDGRQVRMYHDDHRPSPPALAGSGGLGLGLGLGQRAGPDDAEKRIIKERARIATVEGDSDDHDGDDNLSDVSETPMCGSIIPSAPAAGAMEAEREGVAVLDSTLTENEAIVSCFGNSMNKRDRRYFKATAALETYAYWKKQREKSHPVANEALEAPADPAIDDDFLRRLRNRKAQGPREFTPLDGEVRKTWEESSRIAGPGNGPKQRS